MEQTAKRGGLGNGRRLISSEPQASGLSRRKTAFDSVNQMTDIDAKRRLGVSAVRRVFDSIGDMSDMSAVKKRFDSIAYYSDMNDVKRNAKRYLGTGGTAAHARSIRQIV